MFTNSRPLGEQNVQHQLSGGTFPLLGIYLAVTETKSYATHGARSASLVHRSVRESARACAEVKRQMERLRYMPKQGMERKENERGRRGT